jgi:hypothetical protein
MSGLLLAPGLANAGSITVPNFSFESQVAGQPFYANPQIDSWQKAPQPGYFDPNIFQVTWDQTAGTFFDAAPGNPSPILNLDGAQGAYLLGFPGVSLFQDYNTTDWNHPTPTHAFDATFEVGKSYQLTIGVLGKGGLTDGSTLMLGLYYGNSSNPQTVGSTFAVYSAATFPTVTNLVDFTVNVPMVQASDAWAGQHIGIEIINLGGPSAGYWDLDNVRLTSVPEPAVGTLVLGALGVWVARRRSRG